MDVERFARELPELFNSFPQSPHPRDRRFRAVLDAVPGLARENNLALLNLAGRLLEPGESYVEVGTWKGTSLIAAMLGNEGDFVAIDDFSFRDGTADELHANLARFGLDGATVLEGDAFELIGGGALAGRRVGAYYYDAAHGYEEHLRGLEIVEPFLSDHALLIVDDTDWPQVEAAVRDYVARRANARTLVSIGGKERGQPGWWEGVQVLAWEARTG